MSFDFSTLVTDRLQSDVDERNAKGTYNAADLNRVTAAMEALDEMFRAYGYHSGYTPILVASRGAPVGQLPEGYTRLQYIESSGTQYINTGVSPGNYTITLDFQFSVNGTVQLMGHTDNAGWYFGVNEINYYDCGGDGAVIPLNAGERRTIKVVHSQNSQTLEIDGITQSSNKSTHVTEPFSLFKITNANDWVSGKLYNASFLSETSEAIRIFVPCKNPSGEVGLYDAAGNQFYGNDGDGVFTAGPDAPQPEPEPVLDPYTWYESDIPLQSQMAQYLANLAALRGVLAQVEAEPPTPESMEFLTYLTANRIEEILQQLDSYLAGIGQSFLRAGMGWAAAGTALYIRNGGQQ